LAFGKGKTMIDVHQFVEVLEDKKALDIKVLNFKGVSVFFDYFVICTAQNPRQIQALIDGVEEAATSLGMSVRAIEGKPDSGWVIVDLFDYVIHIFSESQRAFYQLDKLWLGLEEA